jgi:hypothetical protein
MKKNIFLLSVLFCFLITTNIMGQYASSTYSRFAFEPHNMGMPSPNVSDFVKYGNLNIDYYYGLLNFSINLPDYKDNDFDIPILIKYISNGFIPYKRPSLVGYNWVLQCGGFITRELKGAPDDNRGNYTKNNDYIADGLLVAVRDKKFRNYSDSDLLKFKVNKTTANSAYTDFEYDMDPDIFKFSFGKYSGSFIINNQGLPQLLSENGCKIDIDSLSIQSYSTTDNPINSIIKIITPDGFIYKFGGNVSFLEYVKPNNPNGCKMIPRYITSWFLNSITAPNNRILCYTYNNQLQKNEYHNIVYSYTSYTSLGTSITTYDNYSDYYNVVANPININDTHTYSNDFIMIDQVYTPIIQSILVDNTKIQFDTIQSANGFFDESDKTINLKKISFIHDGQIVKHVDFDYITNGKYQFLSALINNEQTYKFEYNNKITLPNPLTTSLDHWGFWNGRYDTNVTDILSYFTNINKNKRTNTELCDVGLLNKITYPTGGISKIEYEYNRYTKCIKRDSTKYRLYLDSVLTSIPCGGARIKCTCDSDGLSRSIVNKKI